MKLLVLSALAFCLATASVSAQTSSAPNSAGDSDARPWVNITDGSTFNGWKPSDEHSATWQIIDGAFITSGARSHLFYVGSEQPFKDFELQADVRTSSGSNGGIYIHTAYQASGWPIEGYEIQVNQSHSDWRKSGSIYSVNDVKTTSVKDDEWYTCYVKVQGKRIIVKINDKVVNDWTEEPNRKPGKDFTRILTSGTIALQAHDPKSRVEYRNIKVRKLD